MTNHATLEASRKYHAVFPDRELQVGDRLFVSECEDLGVYGTVIGYSFDNVKVFHDGVYTVYKPHKLTRLVTFGEVWERLPDSLMIGDRFYDNFMLRSGNTTYVSYGYGDEMQVEKSNTNPIDALIDLAIWVEGRKHE